MDFDLGILKALYVYKISSYTLTSVLSCFEKDQSYGRAKRKISSNTSSQTTILLNRAIITLNPLKKFNFHLYTADQSCFARVPMLQASNFVGYPYKNKPKLYKKFSILGLKPRIPFPLNHLHAQLFNEITQL